MFWNAVSFDLILQGEDLLFGSGFAIIPSDPEEVHGWWGYGFPTPHFAYLTS